MQRRWKWIIGLGIGLLAIAGATAFYFWTVMSQPLYQPGTVRTAEGLSAPLTPPDQTGSDPEFWTVEAGIELFHFEDGTGRPVLVVHGGPGFPFAEPVPGLAPLTDTFRFVYYDQRGSGRSTRPLDRFDSVNYMKNVALLDRSLGLAAQMADIERIRRLLGEEKLLIVAHSFGGFIATLYAAEFPEHVERLVLVATANVLVIPPEDGDLFETIAALLPDDLQAEFADYRKRLFDFGGIFSKSEAELVALNDEMGRFYAAAAEAAGHPVPSGQGAVRSGGWMAFAVYFGMGRRADFRPALAQVSAPVLILHGSEDLQPEAASRTYEAALPNAEVHIIEGAGHFTFFDQPDALAAAIGRFLDGAAP